MDFKTLLTQSKDYARVINMMEGITGDAELRKLLLSPQAQGGVPNETPPQPK